MSDNGEGSPAPERTIPYTRFQKLVEERNGLKSQIEDLAGQVQSLTEKGATADTLAEQLRAAQGEVESVRAGAARFRTIAGAGITDPDLVEAVEWQYGRLPEEGRPELADVLKGWTAKPDDAPSLLRPHLQRLATPSKPPGPRPPKPPRSGGDDSGAGEVTAEQLAAARASGDLVKLKALLARNGSGLFSTTR